MNVTHQVDPLLATWAQHLVDPKIGPAYQAPPKMARSTRDAWCTALRSGRYKQATNKLYDDDAHAFCCLGVLKHLETQTEPRTWTQNDLYAGKDECLYAASPTKPFLTIAKHLACMNDGREVIKSGITFVEIGVTRAGVTTFAQIADWIEANVPVYEDITTEDAVHAAAQSARLHATMESFTPQWNLSMGSFNVTFEEV